MADMGRADAAFDHVMRAFQLQIDAARRDWSLTPAQRAAAIKALKMRQAVEAKGAKKQIVDEERQNAQARWRLAKAWHPKPSTPES